MKAPTFNPEIVHEAEDEGSDEHDDDVNALLPPMLPSGNYKKR